MVLLQASGWFVSVCVCHDVCVCVCREMCISEFQAGQPAPRQDVATSLQLNGLRAYDIMRYIMGVQSWQHDVLAAASTDSLQASAQLTVTGDVSQRAWLSHRWYLAS
jgi:hypothetical protein